MEPPPRRYSVLKRALLLALAALSLRLLYSAFLATGAAWPLRPALGLTARTYAHADVGAPDAWRSRQWRRAVDYHAAVLAAHHADGVLAPSSRAVCLGGAQEALAMRELGVPGAVAIAKKRSPPLVVAGDHRRLPFDDSSVDFVFAGRVLDSAKRPSSLAAEATRILKPEGGVLVHQWW